MPLGLGEEHVYRNETISRRWRVCKVWQPGTLHECHAVGFVATLRETRFMHLTCTPTDHTDTV
jgi:hypothetical protein